MWPQNGKIMKPRKFRMPDTLYNSIPGPNKSAWVRKAIHQNLQDEMGLTSEYTDAIKEIKNTLRGLGININQIAKKANQGVPVNLSDPEKDILLKAIMKADKHTLKILRLFNV